MIVLPRRKFLTGLAALVATPAIVKASSLMPVKSYDFLTLDDYVNDILNPMLEKYRDSMIGTHIINYDLHTMKFEVTRLVPQNIWKM